MESYGGLFLKKNEVLLLLTDRWNDWEASYTIAVMNSYSDYTVKTIGIDKADKVSMGGSGQKSISQ